MTQSGGNVGVGTTTPGSLLDLNGASTATNTNNYNSGAFRLTGNYWNSSASAPDYWSIQNDFGTGANPTSVLTFIHSGTSGSANIGFYSVPSGIVTFGHSQLATSTNNYNSPFFQVLARSWTGTASQGEAFNLQTILGVGANPTSTLNISHSGGTGFSGVQIPFLGINGAPLAGTSLNIAGFTGNGATAYGLQVHAPTGATNNYAASFLGGSVGIGTTSPGFMLDVQSGQVNSSGGYCINGSNCITAWPTGNAGTVTSITAGVGLAGGTITNSGTISLNLANPNAWTGAQTFGTTTNFPGPGVWNSGGYVGIGTTAPAQPLHVTGSPAVVRVGQSTDSNSYLELTDQTYADGILNKVTSSGDAMLDFNASPTDGKSNATIRLFRLTNTTGIPSLQLFKGNNSASVNTQLAGNGTSYINALGGHVGIGTTSPGFMLDVQSGQVNSSGGYCINGSNCITAWPVGNAGTVTSITAGTGLTGGTITNSGTISLNLANPNAWTGAQTFGTATNFPGPGIWNSGGNVGIGTTAPAQPLHVTGSPAVVRVGQSTDPNSYLELTDQSYADGILNKVTSSGEAMLDFNASPADGKSNATIRLFRLTNTTGIPSLQLFEGNNSASVNTQLAGNGTSYINALVGNVGIGTANPAAKLDVNGSINISGSGAGITFPNGGGTQTVAWTGVLCGGDYAEAMSASGGKRSYEPGDVLVLTKDGQQDVAKSSEPYSTMVAGIYATKPGVIGKRQSLLKQTDDLPMAMVGVVPTKVSAENGAIRRGDLLVSSATPGYAMKGTDRARLVGAVIGKAMGSLDSGSGIIEVLVTLQ